MTTQQKDRIKGLFFGQAIGDAGTNGAVAGSILGAKFGYESIPKHLVDVLHNKEILENKYNEFIEILKSRKEKFDKNSLYYSNTSSKNISV